jgi:ComF family protein
MKKFIEFLQDVIFPKKCLGCGKVGSFLCEDCKLNFELVNLCCPVCWKSSLDGSKHDDCFGKYKLDGLASVWKYQGVIKNIIHFLKFNGGKNLISDLIDIAGRVIEVDLYRLGSFAQFFYLSDTEITYVPLTKRRRNERGYNQAEKIAFYLSRLKNKNSVCLLKKNKETDSQTKLNKKDRLKNLKDVFIFSSKIVPKNIVLVDDVVTTGSTLNECAKVLKKAGVEKVWGFTLTKTSYV